MSAQLGADASATRSAACVRLSADVRPLGTLGAALWISVLPGCLQFDRSGPGGDPPVVGGTSAGASGSSTLAPASQTNTSEPATTSSSGAASTSSSGTASLGSSESGDGSGWVPFGDVHPLELDEIEAGSRLYAPSVTDDHLRLYFANRGDETGYLQVAVRDAVEQPWGEARRATLDLPVNLFSPQQAVTASGNSVITAFRQSGNGPLVIGEAEVLNLPWTLAYPEPLDEDMNFTIDLNDPVLHPAGFEVYFAAAPEGHLDLYGATRMGPDAPFLSPTKLDLLNSAADESRVWVSADHDLFVFGSNRNGDYDLFRWTPDAEEPIELAEVSSAADEQDPWLSADTRTLYFVRETEAGSSLFCATRP